MQYNAISKQLSYNIDLFNFPFVFLRTVICF